MDRAWRLLVHLDRSAAATLAACLTTLVPLAGQSAGASSGWAWGTVALEIPDDHVRLAETLVHETQHLLMSAADDLVSLTVPGDDSRWYAPWRTTPRPLAGLLQGCYAFLAVTAFWRDLLRDGERRDQAEVEFARWREATYESVASITGATGLTAAGRRFAHGIADRLRPWLEEPVRPEADRIAVQLRRRHRAEWG
ncbi:HEXXH motif-containing putative peptide modification protein [Nonomuraea sp. NBC_01738]|nr:HEXXH motif-containing putative peptide modification protein [Nonomuraea sp. NBC_01738]